MPGRVAHIVVLLTLSLSLVAGVAYAFQPLVERLPRDARGSDLFANREQRARVKDGPLIGRGHERSAVAADGRLLVERTRTYLRAVHPDTGKVVELPDPWHMRSTLVLSPSLRLIETTTTLSFHRSVDRAMGYPFSEKFDRFFEWNRVHTVASRAGNRLTRTARLDGKVVEHDSYDYPGDAIPIEIVGLVLAHAVKNRVPDFDFELLLPGGDQHGIASRVHRTRDVKRFARGYPVPLAQVGSAGELAVVEMWLASPIKRVFFPHHFFLVYSSENPAELVALWGGDPDDSLQAYRE
jgi:hypothetical protein